MRPSYLGARASGSANSRVVQFEWDGEGEAGAAPAGPPFQPFVDGARRPPLQPFVNCAAARGGPPIQPFADGAGPSIEPFGNGGFAPCPRPRTVSSVW